MQQHQQPKQQNQQCIKHPKKITNSKATHRELNQMYLYLSAEQTEKLIEENIP
jgi:hypothetical protein